MGFPILVRWLLYIDSGPRLYIMTSRQGNGFRIARPVWAETTGRFFLRKGSVMWNFYICCYPEQPLNLVNKQYSCQWLDTPCEVIPTCFIPYVVTLSIICIGSRIENGMINNIPHLPYLKLLIYIALLFVHLPLESYSYSFNTHRLSAWKI